MSEMVERVARAICRAGICGPKDHLDEQENSNWRKFVPEARAAIEAMREPTEQMVIKAYENSHEANSARLDSNIDFAEPMYRAMIDAALGK